VTAPLYYVAYPCTPMPRKLRLGRWTWTIRDGATGPVLASGTAWTERGALHCRDRAAARAVPITGVCRDDRPVLHPLGPVEAYRLTCRLELDDVPVTVKVDGPGTVVLWPAVALTTKQEVHAMHVVLDATDAPVRWAGVAPC
jgi:hypothetical protein